MMPITTRAMMNMSMGSASRGSDLNVQHQLFVLAGEHVAEAAYLGGDLDAHVEHAVLVEPAVEQGHHLVVGVTVVVGEERDGERHALRHDGPVHLDRLERDEVEKDPIDAVLEEDELAGGHGVPQLGLGPAAPTSVRFILARLARRSRETWT